MLLSVTLFRNYLLRALLGSVQFEPVARISQRVNLEKFTNYPFVKTTCNFRLDAHTNEETLCTILKKWNSNQLILSGLLEGCGRMEISFFPNSRIGLPAIA